MIQLLVGDCRVRLKDIPEKSVHCVVTSPPYFGLRDYQTGRWDGGDEGCDHVVGEMRRGLGLADSVANTRGGAKKVAEIQDIKARSECPKCGARRIDEQIGLEPTPDEFVAAIVEVFREVRRVLRDDGTVWLNLGDSYVTRPNGPSLGGSGLEGSIAPHAETRLAHALRSNGVPSGTKHKDLLGIPWMVAFALRADGWYLRQEIIWHKPNPMPESVRDRCTKSHETIFLLSKSATYFYDADAISEGASYPDGPNSPESIASPHGHGFSREAKRKRGLPPKHAKYPESSDQSGLDQVERGGKRNKRSVWTVATTPFSIELCGACRRYYGVKAARKLRSKDGKKVCACGETDAWVSHFATFPPDLIEPCILAGSPKGGVVLDPFGGAGTTALVADRLQRDAVLIELNPDYADLLEHRLHEDGGLYLQITREAA